MTEKKGSDVLTKELEVYKKAGANLLMPSTEIAGLSEFHAPVIEKVLLSANPNDGDVYPHDTDGKKFRPTKQALMKLSVCAGVIWSPTESKRVDNNADRNYIAYKAVGGIKKPDGQPVFFSAEYDIDFEVLEEELRDSYTKKAEGKTDAMKWIKDKSAQFKADWINDCVKRDMLQKRKFKLRLCEAGAMNRVLRMLLGIKQAYTIEELKKPFVMARIVFRPDFSDKEVRQQFIDASIKAMTGVYGPGAVATAEKHAEPIDVTPLPEDEDGETGKGNGNAIESQVADFTNADVEGQSTALYEMARKKNWDIYGWLKSAKMAAPNQMKPERRIEMFKHLLTLPDAQAADQTPDDEIPF